MTILEKTLAKVIYDYTGDHLERLEIMRNFRVSENQRGFEKVFLVYGSAIDHYFVIWRWTNMKDFALMHFVSYNAAYSYYQDRKSFALKCN